MQYSLGSVLYYWSKPELERFYNKAATSSADIIYLGETVCSKRRETKSEDYIDFAKQLALTGKQVVISTLALLQAPSEKKELKKLIDNGDFLVEAHDFGVIELLHQRNLPFVAGHGLNCYNAYSLKILQQQGMVRWCMPVELSRDWLQNLLIQCDELKIRDKFAVEVFSYGHLPLAYSARCFTARSENLAKDECATCCIKYPQGREVFSQEQQQVFVLNGIQTQSGYCYNLGNDLKSMQNLVDIVRISPENFDVFSLIDQFRDNQNGEKPINLQGQNMCNGYWLQIAGLELR